MSWLTPKHLEDASRVLRGVALVLARAGVDSAQHRAALQQAQAAAAAAARVAVANLHVSDGASAVHAVPVAPLVQYLYPETVAQLQLQQHHQLSHQAAPLQQQGQQEAAGLSESQSYYASMQQPDQRGQRHEHQQQGQPTGVPAAADSQAQDLLAVRPDQQPQPQPQQPQQQHDAQHPQPVPSAAIAAAQAPGAERLASAAGVGAQDTTRAATSPLVASSESSDTPSSSSSGSSSSNGVAGHPGMLASQQQQHEQQQQQGHIDSWISGHESVTTEAEATLQTAAGAARAAAGAEPQQEQQPQQQPAKVLRERRVPSTQIGRALGFASMGASLLLGSLTDSIGRTLTGSGTSADASASSGAGGSGGGSGGGGGGAGGVYGSFITQSNAERLANALCRMRGAALKIGQMLSIQDENVLPPQIQAALERVRAGADVMPRSQLEEQLVGQLGRDWASKVAHFDWTPRAAASIGQVHAATLHDGSQVAMKIQYPGVARSIESDVDNLMRLISIANILPKGLYVESAVKVAKRELALECNYAYEAAAQARFRELVAGDALLSGASYVPRVYPELSSRQVLTTEWVSGVAIDKVAEMDQGVRDAVGTWLLRLTLRELYDWRFMQTDPNWGNFLYDADSGRLNLIDFGAAKEYPARFVEQYLRMVHACAERDRQGVVDMSVALGFLTGDESAVMLDAHTQAGFVVGLPFATPGVYDFGAHSGLTPRVAELGAVMLKHRLTPPPEESYSLHRKLSGAFLACMKLRARVPCRDLFMATYNRHTGGAGRTAAAAAAAGPPDAAVSSDEQDMPRSATA